MTAVTNYNEQYKAYMKFKEDDPLVKYTEISTLQRLLGSVENLTILDLGCGFGYHSTWLASAGAQKGTVQILRFAILVFKISYWLFLKQ